MLHSFSLRGLSYQRDIELNYYAVLARLCEACNANRVAKTERFITNIFKKKNTHNADVYERIFALKTILRH